MLELQLWHCLPAFCSWATDLPEAYALYVKVGVVGCSGVKRVRRPKFTLC